MHHTLPPSATRRKADHNDSIMSEPKKLKIRNAPPSPSKGGPFRAFVSAQILEHFGGKSETAAWVLGKEPTPVTLWREQAPPKGQKVDPIGNGAIQLSDKVRKMAQMQLGDDIVLVREQSWVPNAQHIILEEAYSAVRPQLGGIQESDRERQERMAQEHEDEIYRKSVQEPAYNALYADEVAICRQQIEVYNPKTSTKNLYTVKQIDGSFARGLHWITDDTRVEIVRPTKYEMKIPRDQIGGATDQLRDLDAILYNFDQTLPAYFDSRRRKSRFVLLTGPAGTGKTTIMNSMARLNWPKVFKLKNDAKAVTRLRNAFHEARMFGRAMVIADNLEEIAGVDRKESGPFIEELLSNIQEFRADKNTRVLFIAATRNHEDIHPALLEPPGLKETIRIGLPDDASRKAILNINLKNPPIPENVVDDLVRRTHAFSAADLGELVEVLLRKKDSAAQQRRPNSSISSNSDPVSHTAKDWHIYADQALKNVRPTTMQGLHIDIPETRFSEIGGQHELKKILRRKLYAPLEHPEYFAQGHKKPLKGLLMYGPPGCSKTLMARAVATEFRLNFLLVNASELISSYVGESEKRIRELFRQARDAKPCIIFFDEFETLGAARGGRDSHGGLNIVQTLLTEMDGVRPLEKVIVIAATNRPDILDNALLRFGRLHPHVLVGPPDLQAREEIVKLHLRDIDKDKIDLDINETAAMIARQTDGFSGAQMVELITEAIDEAFDASGLLVRLQHLEKARSKIKPGVTQEELDRFEDWSKTVNR